MKDCLFCKIVAGEIPSIKIYEDDDILAFSDIRLVNPGHILLVPKKHSRNIFDTENEVLKKISLGLKKLSIAVKNGMGTDGINIHMNNEPAAGQVIFHTHIHIIPRFEGDNLKMWQGKEYREKDKQNFAEKIKSQL